VTGLIFTFCAPELVFGGTGGVPFSIFARPDSFSAVSRALGPIFNFYAPKLIFDGTKGVGYRFYILRARTRFRRYRGRRVPISCFALPDLFLAVPWASGPFSMFFASGHIFGGTEVVGVQFSCFALPTRFRWYRGRLVPFSYFAYPDSFSAVSRASGPVFLFCPLRSVFGSSGGFGSRFNVLHPLTRFQRYRGRRVPFSCSMLPDSFSAVSSASGLVFKFCAPRLVFDAFSTRFRLHVLRSRTRFRRYRWRLVLSSCFALPNSFSAVPMASGPVFMFCAPGLVFDNNQG
jgi:hypothetical protein